MTTPSQSEVDLLLPLGDHQHSTRVVLAHDANDATYVRQSLDYAQFGRVTATLGAGGLADSTGVVTAFAHHGSLLDEATGLQRKGERWYSPDLGRFVSEDPIQDGTNWFMFAGNNPVNYADPSGLSMQGHPLAKPTSLGNPFVTAGNLLYQGAKAIAPHVGSAFNCASQATSNFVNQAIEARMVTTWTSHDSMTHSGRSYPGGLSGGRSFDNVSYQEKAAAYRREAALVNQVYGSSFKGEASYETSLFHQTEIRSYLAESNERGYQDWVQRNSRVHLFGETWVSPWNSQASGFGDSIPAYGRSTGRAFVGMASGAAAGSASGAATGALVGGGLGLLAGGHDWPRRCRLLLRLRGAGAISRSGGAPGRGDLQTRRVSHRQELRSEGRRARNLGPLTRRRRRLISLRDTCNIPQHPGEDALMERIDGVPVRKSPESQRVEDCRLAN